MLVLVHEDAIAAAERAAQRLEALAQERVVVAPRVAREAALAGPGLRRVGPVAEGRGDDGPRGAVEQQLGMARDVGRAIVNLMSAKSPRPRRSRMCASVSAYGSAGAAPTTSRPSSSARRASSAALMRGLCP